MEGNATPGEPFFSFLWLHSPANTSLRLDRLEQLTWRIWSMKRRREGLRAEPGLRREESALYITASFDRAMGPRKTAFTSCPGPQEDTELEASLLSRLSTPPPSHPPSPLRRPTQLSTLVSVANALEAGQSPEAALDQEAREGAGMPTRSRFAASGCPAVHGIPSGVQEPAPLAFTKSQGGFGFRLQPPAVCPERSEKSVPSPPTQVQFHQARTQLQLDCVLPDEAWEGRVKQ